jgi:isopentenyldiphosphate isomerase
MKKIVCVFIFNSSDEMLLQLRAATEKSYPLYWDFSASGAVEKKDNSIDDAAKRELKEELGITPRLISIGQDQYKNEKLYLYTGTYSEPCSPGPEVEDTKFASIEVIKKMIDAKENFHPEFIYMFNKLY